MAIEMSDYRWKYLNDPIFHAQVDVGAQVIMRHWEAQSVLNQTLGDDAWAEAKLLAFQIMKAVDHLSSQFVKNANTQPDECLCAEIKRYRELVQRGDPATMERRKLAREIDAMTLRRLGTHIDGAL